MNYCSLCINARVKSHTMIPLSTGGSEQESVAGKVLPSNRHFHKVKYITQIQGIMAGPHYTNGKHNL